MFLYKDSQKYHYEIFIDLGVVTAALFVMVKKKLLKLQEHLNISKFTLKCLKGVKQSVVSDHLLECNCSIHSDQCFNIF